MRVVLTLLVLLFQTACASGGGAQDPRVAEATFVRPVVLPAHPLALSNPQDDTTTWPIWGATFDLSRPISIRIALEAMSSRPCGVLVAGPGTPETRRTLGLLWNGDGWVLREAAGRKIVSEVPVPAERAASLVLEVGPQGRSLTVRDDGRLLSFTPTAPLHSGPASAGIYVELSTGAALEIHDLALTQSLPAASHLGSPLRSLSARRGLTVGSAVDVWPPLHDIGFEALLGEQFGAAAPTEFYWSTTRGEDDDYFFLPADLIVNYAMVHDLDVTGMFLVWDFELPRWLSQVAKSGGARALGKVYDQHVQTLVARYRGRVDAWVVVNEAIWGPDEVDGGPARFADSIWHDALGAEFIERAFRTARAADPDALLLYNETGAEELGEKSDFLHAMARDFLAREVPLDGIGFQFHIDAAKPPDMRSVRANLERFGALGLEVHITEFDVSVAELGGTTQEKLALQGRLYRDVLATCLAVTACKSYTVFGFSDRYAWDELGDASPLLFDEDYAAKPAFRAVHEALLDAPGSELESRRERYRLNLMGNR